MGPKTALKANAVMGIPSTFLPKSPDTGGGSTLLGFERGLFLGYMRGLFRGFV